MSQTSTQVRERREGVGRLASEVSSGEWLIMHDELIDILQFLHYETSFCDRELRPIPRAFFAVPHASAPGLQFKYFSSLSAWLLTKADAKANWTSYDDPQTVCSNVCGILQEVGIWLDVTPGKLKPGFGDAVIATLLALAQVALKKVKGGTTLNRPSYPDEALADEAAVDEDAILGDEVDPDTITDETGLVAEDEDYYG